jgi:hypothetical protein
MEQLFRDGEEANAKERKYEDGVQSAEQAAVSVLVR